MNSFKRIRVMFDRYDDCFNQIKALLDISNENHDTMIKFILDKTLNDISSYLHRDLTDIPLALDTSIISMVLTYITTHNLVKSQNDDNSNVTSITEGNVQVQYKTTADLYTQIQKANPLTDDYTSQLKQYRKLAK